MRLVRPRIYSYTLAPHASSHWPLRVVSSLGLKVILTSLHSRLTLSLLPLCVENYGTDYHEISYGYACNTFPKKGMAQVYAR